MNLCLTLQIGHTAMTCKRRPDTLQVSMALTYRSNTRAYGESVVGLPLRDLPSLGGCSPSPLP